MFFIRKRSNKCLKNAAAVVILTIRVPDPDPRQFGYLPFIGSVLRTRILCRIRMSWLVRIRFPFVPGSLTNTMPMQSCREKFSVVDPNLFYALADTSPDPNIFSLIRNYIQQVPQEWRWYSVLRIRIHVRLDICRFLWGPDSLSEIFLAPVPNWNVAVSLAFFLWSFLSKLLKTSLIL